MEGQPFIDDFPIKTFIYIHLLGGPVALFD
jgi:hypothetical protein